MKSDDVVKIREATPGDATVVRVEARTAQSDPLGELVRK
jgi:hypothetical protein